MEAYSRALLVFAHALARSGRNVEAFCFCTRLTRVTAELAGPSVEQAVGAAQRAVGDWRGGTRIGAALASLNADWVPRGVARGAIALILSDGLERDDPALLGRETARLQRSVRALIWVNPLAGSARYQPLAHGMAAALPFLDRFLPGHSVDALEALVDVIAQAGDARRAAGGPPPSA
jgi:hypothetical protein